MRAQLTVTIGRHSSAGRKPANQDFHGALVPDGLALTTKGIALAIADGISTSKLGAAAAETAVRSFLTDYYCTSDAWPVQLAAERVIAATNSWMHSQNGRPLSDEERERGLVCTFTALVLKSRQAHLFHIGDCRIARVSGKSLEGLTEAHRVDLGGGESYLGRAMGVSRHVEIDHMRLPLQPGDTFVLSSDGVHEHLPDRRIAGLIEQADDLDAAAEAIVAAALAAGSQDNLTVVLVRIDTLPAGEVEDLVAADGLLPPAPHLRAGTSFEGYAILRELHAGSRSHVYVARDEADGSLVALKVPSTEHGEDSDELRRLLLEEWIARRIDHPHVLKAAPQRTARGHVYSVSEYFEGQTLAQWMADRPRPELHEVRSLIGQIAAALQALHKRRIVHRDLRPANLLVDATGTVKLIDFGSARIDGVDEVAPRETEDAAFAGTMQYSAPELYLGEGASEASDLFSLGVIAYQLLTGRLPYGSRLATAGDRAAQRRLRYAPIGEVNPAVPDWVDAAIAKAVAIDPSRRYGLLSEFVYDLSHPNHSLTNPQPRPLVERDPVRLWQAISAILLVLLIAALARPDIFHP